VTEEKPMNDSPLGMPPAFFSQGAQATQGADPGRNAHLQMPAAYREAVEAFAGKTGLPAAQLLEGLPFECDGARFRLEHYGAADPNGLVVMVEIGELDPEDEVIALRRLLESNALSPAAVSGYYSLLPGTSMVLYCIRLNLAAEPDAAEAMVRLMGTITTGVKTMVEELTREIERADNPAGQWPGPLA